MCLTVTELIEMDGSFTINTAFNGILSITEPAQYTALRDAVIAGVSIHHDVQYVFRMTIIPVRCVTSQYSSCRVCHFSNNLFCSSAGSSLHQQWIDAKL